MNQRTAVLASLLIGDAPFCSIVLFRAVGHCADTMIIEVRKPVQGIQACATGRACSDSRTCVDIATRRFRVCWCRAMALVPVIMGLLFGTEGLKRALWRDRHGRHAGIYPQQ